MINETIKKIKSKKCIIGVIGLGYVGLPLCIRFAEVGFKVIGFDLDKQRISQLKIKNDNLELDKLSSTEMLAFWNDSK